MQEAQPGGEVRTKWSVRYLQLALHWNSTHVEGSRSSSTVPETAESLVTCTLPAPGQRPERRPRCGTPGGARTLFVCAMDGK